MLPILSHKREIIDMLAAHRRLVVTAPPGTGKSTQIPQFFAEDAAPDRRILVLEPRRIAARSLACRVAGERKEVCGGEVGYQVRFERRLSESTRVVFLTYGTFLQMLQGDPRASRASLVVFDEFHERSLEADMALSWVRYLTETVRPDLALMLLSATIEVQPLIGYLRGCGTVTVEDRSHPVDIRYQPSRPHEPLADQVDRALGALLPLEEAGSVLVFLPGVYEIERAAERIHDRCRRQGYRILTLHGSMAVAGQQEALTVPASEPCVILATNVAETSLTIPGVVAVVDSGIARKAAYDPRRERNTLFTGRITLQNAAQRAGRAGRLTRGVCVRLWSREEERGMAPAIEPEISRLDLAGSMLALSHFYAQVPSPGSGIFPDWLTPPPPERWERALQDLERCGAVTREESFLPSPTPLGARMSRLPLEPVLAALVLAAGSAQERDLLVAMAAVWEGAERPRSESRNLLELAEELMDDRREREFGREIHETRRQLEKLLGNGQLLQDAEIDGEGLRRRVTENWMRLFRHRIAVRQREGLLYDFQDGRCARLVMKKETVAVREAPAELIVALAVHERGGRAQRTAAEIPLFLPVDPSWLSGIFRGEVEESVLCRWDEGRRRPVIECGKRFRGLLFGAREIRPEPSHRPMIADCLVGKLAQGVWAWESDEPAAVQYVNRVRLAASAFPEMGIPSMCGDDWALIFHGACEGRVSLEEVKRGTMLRAIKSYIGPELARFIERNAPESITLPNGRKGRITYFDGSPPELSARLGDFIGYRDSFTLFGGRVRGVFNILAPNFRTVQKTADLGSFWSNAYPSIRQELRRRYPRHPWP